MLYWYTAETCRQFWVVPAAARRRPAAPHGHWPVWDASTRAIDKLTIAVLASRHVCLSRNEGAARRAFRLQSVALLPGCGRPIWCLESNVLVPKHVLTPTRLLMSVLINFKSWDSFASSLTVSPRMCILHSSFN